jgi:hypothetical protein
METPDPLDPESPYAEALEDLTIREYKQKLASHYQGGAEYAAMYLGILNKLLTYYDNKEYAEGVAMLLTKHWMTGHRDYMIAQSLGLLPPKGEE